MAEAAYALIWQAIFLLVGLILAVVLPVRRRWLILAVLPVAVPFGITLHGSVVDRVAVALIAFGFFVSWTVGVLVGRWLQRSKLQN